MKLLLVFHALTQWKKMLNFSTFEQVFSVYVLEHVTQSTLFLCLREWLASVFTAFVTLLLCSSCTVSKIEMINFTYLVCFCLFVWRKKKKQPVDEIVFKDGIKMIKNPWMISHLLWHCKWSVIIKGAACGLVGYGWLKSQKGSMLHGMDEATVFMEPFSQM